MTPPGAVGRLHVDDTDGPFPPRGLDVGVGVNVVRPRLHPTRTGGSCGDPDLACGRSTLTPTPGRRSVALKEGTGEGWVVGRPRAGSPAKPLVSLGCSAGSAGPTTPPPRRPRWEGLRGEGLPSPRQGNGPSRWSAWRRSCAAAAAPARRRRRERWG